ncbi:Golgi to ER traffic protein 4 homolog [Saccoglossus kowalevskii]|uniref:Golgi to ER traffic protein 4 homolog n=1 Tax=Saccoglossus kowalevskii TaxID=10224 RepID=A0ABM0GRF8_SACKO|nr:PREDICTED: Golgi to ER traffic protein 4 homolog [Saccoglossus kowalevskii]
MAANRNRGGVERVLKKLKASVEAGSYYEAHQMYRTLYFRYMAQKKHAEAIELIYSGANVLLTHNQHGSGTDLCMLLIEVLNTSNTAPAADNLDKVSSLFTQLGPDSTERPLYKNAALKWSCKNDPSHKSGHPELHTLLALILWKEKSYYEARYHFLHSFDGQSCATMLIEYSLRQGLRSEYDMFVAQIVLQYLCLKNEETASVVFYTYTEKHPDIQESPPFMQPLLNFIWFLLLALPGGKTTIFSVLCDKYEPAIKRDPSYVDYLSRIGHLFFGMPPLAEESMQPGGVFGNILQSLFTEDEDVEVNQPLDLD